MSGNTASAGRINISIGITVWVDVLTAVVAAFMLSSDAERLFPFLAGDQPANDHITDPGGATSRESAGAHQL